MRNIFVKKLIEIAEKDEKIVLLTGDLGFVVLDEFIKRFPKRFYNAGIAEQNMVGVASGLAQAGYIPFCYSIAPFVFLRPFEFIRNCAVFHNFNIKFVGIGGGFEYGDCGNTHYLLEDVALTRLFPNFKSFFPINGENAASLLEKTYHLYGPTYYRIGKNGKSNLDDKIKSYSDSGIEIISENNNAEICCFCLSSTIETLLNKNDKLSDDKKMNIYSLVQVNPAPVEMIINILKKHKVVYTVESHYINGGIGSLIAEIIAENQINCQLKRFGVNDILKTFGNQEFMENKYIFNNF